MKTFRIISAITLSVMIGFLTFSCKEDPEPDLTPSTTELEVAKFDAAPVVDATVDDMWKNARKLIGTTEVPTLANRGTYFNSGGEGVEEDLGLFYPYAGETQDFTMRAGYFDDEIYFLLEWDDADDSKDRQSWYYDDGDGKWKQENKYANAPNDKFYEDKFAFLFPVGEVTGFNASTCYATCHQNLTLEKPKDKHTRHYTIAEDQVVDMWHWKRVRGTYNNKIDDQRIVYAEPTGSSANGRGGDDGQSGYSDNKQTLMITGTTTEVTVPKYVIPNQTDYYWIGENQLGNEAKLITAIDANGVLSYDDGAIDPSEGGYEQGNGVKRIPSVTTRNFEGKRADLSIEVEYTGAGWVAEFHRKLDTGDAEDVIFDLTKEIPFGFATFDNAAIAHAIKAGLVLKFEQ